MARRFQLYITNKNYSSWSLRAWVLMRRLGIPFDEHLTPMLDGASRETFLKFSPTGRVPCLHDLQPPASTAAAGGDNDNGPIVVCESLAIAEYLAESCPDKSVWPADVRARAFARTAAAEMFSGFNAMRDEMGMSVGLRIRLGPDEPSPRLRRDLDRLEKLWAEGLARFGGPWLAGENFTAADAFFAPVALRLQTFGVELADPAAAAYGRRLLELDEVREWAADALREPWREPGHEEDTVRGREVLADYRSLAE